MTSSSPNKQSIQWLILSWQVRTVNHYIRIEVNLTVPGAQQPGTYLSNATAMACLNCVAGNYRYSTTSMFSPTAPCMQCWVGEYASGSGMTDCTSCDAGTYQSASAGTTCSVCEAGIRSDSDIGSRWCYGCRDGTFSSAS
jgi:hypothetical protein